MLTELSRIVKSRYAEVHKRDEMVYHMTEQVVDRAIPEIWIQGVA